MPDRSRLRVGDRIRILRVPAEDLLQREREIAEGAEDVGWTAETFERLLRSGPVVTINRVDDHPWFDFYLISHDGAVEEHTMAIMDDESWERC